MTISYFYTPVFRGYRNRTLAWKRFIYAVYLSAGRCFNIIFKILLLRGIYFTFQNWTLDLNSFWFDIDISWFDYLYIYKFISHRYRQKIAKMWRGKSGMVDKENLKNAPTVKEVHRSLHAKTSCYWMDPHPLPPPPPLHLLSFNSLFGNAWAIVTTST